MIARNGSAASLGEGRGAGGAKQSKKTAHPNSLSAQRQRILDRLRAGPADTITLRRELDVLMPAARVHELIHRFGFSISSSRVTRETDAGVLHRNIGMYALLGEPKGGHHER